ncbi:MAG: glycosyltransferase family 4 protein [Patescibacteria group bacterium]|nr:glycosyltransferase family 4 protein [Patescibacteria group bacterium]
MTNYNFEKEELVSHLEDKFKGLAQKIKPYVLAKGKPFHKRIWDTDFYLLKPGVLFWPLASILAFYLCLVKRIDVIIAQSPLIEGFIGTVLKKVLRKELIVEIHGDWKEGPFLSKRRRFEALQKKIVPSLAKISFKNADKIRAVAAYLIREAKRFAPENNYFLFPTFTNLDSFSREKDTSYQKFILSVGQLEKVKGMDVVIDAFNEISKEFPDFKLIIIGEGSQRKNLELRIKNLGLENKVELKGRLSLEQTKNTMRECYYFILPSLSEGLPRALMEAMVLGKPVIGSNVGGIPDLIKDGQNGFLFIAGDSNELGKKMRILLNNKELSLNMGQAGKELIKNNFSNKKYIENYIKMVNL